MDLVELVIDTDIIIDFLRRQSDVLEKAIGRYACAITAVTAYELQAVAVQSDRQMQALQDFLQVVAVLPFDAEAARHSAEIWRTLQATGQLIGLPDTLIAGTCLAFGLPLLTRNSKHYQRIEQLTLKSPTELNG